MLLKKLMSHEDRYIDFVGSIESFNEKTFDMQFVYILMDTASAQYAFSYWLGVFLEHLRNNYLNCHMNLIRPPMILGIESDRVFIDIKGGPQLPQYPEQIIDIDAQDFNQRRRFQRYYQDHFNEKRQRLEFFSTNLVPQLRWRH